MGMSWRGLARGGATIVAGLLLLTGTFASGKGAGADQRHRDGGQAPGGSVSFLPRAGDPSPALSIGGELTRGLAAPAPRLPVQSLGPAVPAMRTVTYSISVRGVVHSDLRTFADAVARTYADARGWAGAGLDFVRVPSGGDFTVVLTQDALMPSYGPDCDRFWSCRQDRFVAINDDRFDSGSPFWPGPVDEYRHMVINHETGHWLGFGHEACGGPGQPAPVMMQQSKGVEACTANPWPLPSELDRERLAVAAGLVPAAR